MHSVPVASSSLEGYLSIADGELIEEIHSLGSRLRGARVAHINATHLGGGVAEILHSIIPLYNGLGIEACWLVLEGHEPFFDVTKKLHNALQGAEVEFSQAEKDLYMEVNEQNAKTLAGGFDVIFVHDPQPAALRRLAANSSRHWVWRSHIDTSTPNFDAWHMISLLVNDYDAAVFSLPDFVGPGVAPPVTIIPPAIDPLVA